MRVPTLAAWRGEDGEGAAPFYMSALMPRRVSATAGWLVGLGAAAVLLVWTLTGPSAGNGGPQLLRIVPLTATGFFGLSLALLAGARFLGRGGPRPLAAGGSKAVLGGAIWALAVGSLRPANDIFGWQLPIDAFPLNPLLPPQALEGLRMAPATALNFVLLGGALLVAGGRPWQRLAYQAFVFLALMVACLSMSHYLYGGEPLVPLAQMSIPTTAFFLVAGISILFLWPDVGLVRLLRSPTEGGQLMRWLLVPILVAPPLLGWLRLQGELAGFYGMSAGIALFALSNVALFGALLWGATAWLDHSDRERRGAESKTRKQLERLHLLHHITRATAERQDPASIFQVAARNVEERLPADFACICLHDTVADRLRLEAIGLRGHQLAGEIGLDERSTFAVDPNGLRRCLGGLLVYEPDLRQIAMPFAQKLAGAGLRALVLAPLTADSGVVGILVVARMADSGFTSGECEFLRQLGDSVALAYSQAELGNALRAAYVDLQQSQRAVAQQQRLRALGEMASGIAHDINNSISPAALISEMLLEREKSLSVEGRGQLEIVQRAVSDVAQTVSRMQELYRPRAHDKAFGPIELNKLVEQVLELTRSRWRDIPQERGIVIEVMKSFQPDLPRVRGVESEVRESLTNLVFNAVDAMPEGGLLSLRTRTRRDNRVRAPGLPPRELVVLEVGDSGLGMNEETRRRCLEPFYTTKGEHGSGLGLPMVFSVAERHEADIEIDSTLGSGTVVRLIFPAAEVQRLLVPEAAGPVRERLRILVIDDDPMILETVNEALTGDGHWVTVADGGKAGLAAFRSAQSRKRPFDLVLSDLGMPEIDGRRVATGIKELSPQTPVVLLTGWGHRMVSEGELPPHVDFILSKPPRLKDLREALQRFQLEN
jgi:signal transduction histidine kinase/ActR/RegA family two-component response regulator